MTFEVAGPRLTLRLPHPADAPALLRLAGDPEVTRWFSWGPYRTLDEPRMWIAAQAERRAAGVQLDFVVHDLDAGPVGVTGLAELAPRDGRAVVGTWLGRERWGTGANAEAKALVAHVAFARCGLRRLGAYSNPGNGRSAAALERLGFRREGTLRAWHRHGDRLHDVHVWSLLRDEWEQGPLAAVPVVARGEPSAAWRQAGAGVSANAAASRSSAPTRSSKA